MQDISITEARAQLGELADKVKYSGDPIMLTKNGKASVGLVPAYVAEEWAGMRNAPPSRCYRIHGTLNRNRIDRRRNVTMG